MKKRRNSGLKDKLGEGFVSAHTFFEGFGSG
jgi:hypothetical protein